MNFELLLNTPSNFAVKSFIGNSKCPSSQCTSVDFHLLERRIILMIFYGVFMLKCYSCIGRYMHTCVFS